MTEAGEPWTCPRRKAAAEAEAADCPGCGAGRAGAGGGQRRCRKCFCVFSGPGACPICASRECEDVD